MKNVVVIGAGKIGATVAGLLASTGDYQVTLADRSAEVLASLDRDERIRTVAADVEDSSKLVDLLNGQFAVLNAAPFHLTTRIARGGSRGADALSRFDRGRGEHAPREGARGRCQHRLHPAMRARARLRVHRGLRHGEALRGARQRQAAGRGAAAISLQRAQLQPDLEHGWRHQRILRALRSDRERRAPRGAAAGGEGGVFARRRHLRSVQHLGRARDALRHSRRQGPQSQLPHHPLSGPCRDHARAAQRSAPARPPRCAQGHPGARGADDAAGCGDHLRHRQRPQRVADWSRKPTPTRSTAATWTAGR